MAVAIAKLPTWQLPHPDDRMHSHAIIIISTLPHKLSMALQKRRQQQRSQHARIASKRSLHKAAMTHCTELKNPQTSQAGESAALQ